jgi:hypothetical protein
MQILVFSICQRHLNKNENIQVVYLSKTFEKNANTQVDIYQRPWNKNANTWVLYLSKIWAYNLVYMSRFLLKSCVIYPNKLQY